MSTSTNTQSGQHDYENDTENQSEYSDDGHVCANCGTDYEFARHDPCPDCGQFECPFVTDDHDDEADDGDCQQTFDTHRGLATHYTRTHGTQLALPERECALPACQGTFEPRRVDSDKRYCSHDCHGISMQKTGTFECAHCGRTETVSEKEARRRVNCSDACRYEQQATRPDPANEYQYLYVLYVIEERTIKDVTRRYPGTLGRDAIRRRLIDYGFHENHHSYIRSIERLSKRTGNGDRKADEYFNEHAHASNFDNPTPGYGETDTGDGDAQ